MEYESLTRALQLVEILAEGQFLTVAQMAERSRLHPRRVYRLLETFPRVGLTLERQSHSYRLRADAPFLKRVTSFLHFTPDEVLTLRQILTAVPNSSVQARLLREKLEHSTSESLFIPPDVDEVTGRNIRTMFEAIEGERIVVLRGYRSSRSQKRDRYVEPYAFLPGNRDVRCFEISTRTNKTFNLSRAEEVELVDLRWSYREEHRPLLVDLFHFSGECTTRVALRLGVLAKSVLLDEYPQAERRLTQEDDSHWLWEDEFCSMKGVGRFVMGLLEDIEIVDAPELEDYIREQISQAATRFMK
jgi:HTH domain protein